MISDSPRESREEVVKGALEAIDEICMKYPSRAILLRSELLALGTDDATLHRIKKAHSIDAILSSYADAILGSHNRLQAKCRVIDFYISRKKDSVA